MLCRQMTREENQDVGHGKMEVGQSHPALLCSGSIKKRKVGSNDISKIWISVYVCVCAHLLYEMRKQAACQAVVFSHIAVFFSLPLHPINKNSWK